MGWTGVQYSMFRIGLSVAVAKVCFVRLAFIEGPAWAFFFLGLIGAVALAFGWRDRAITINLIALVGGLGALADGAPLILPEADVIFTASLLVLHLLVPVTPFGSWDARARVDPRGDWSRPAWVGHLAWIWLAVIHFERALVYFLVDARTTAQLDYSVLSTATALLEIAFAVTILRVGWRAPAWVALTLWQVAWLAAFGFETGAGALLLLHFFAADPGWWPGQRLDRGRLAKSAAAATAEKKSARLFYDGECGFCHRSVRFILSEEAGTPSALALRFAPLQGELFARTIAERDDLDADSLPDSIVLILEDGTLLTQSAAALEIASRLGGLWRGVALIGRIIPTPLLDGAYDLVASIRKRIFTQPKDACPILPPELRARFD